MRRFRTTIVLAFATFLSISICSAQQTASTSVPNLVRYSGTLKDAQGAALSSSTAVGVTFSIYKQQDGGAAVWMETQNVTPDANGQYNVILGSTTATGLPDDLFLQQEQRWLGVQVQGEAEQARVLLVSVPYAFKAHEAETLGGLPPSSFVKVPPSDAASSTSTNVGSGTAGNKGTTAVVASQSNGSTVAQDGSWAREGTTVKLSNETDSVGIGTSTPKTKLDVAGSIHASGPISSGNSITLNGLTNSITADNVVPLGGQRNHIYIGGDNYPGPLIPFSRIQVGIGTKSPTIIGINKLALFDPVFPTLGIIAPVGGPNNFAGVELTVATCPGCWSNFAIPGDAVLRVPGTTPGVVGNNLILTARGVFGGIRFGTGPACGGAGCETEKMTLVNNGNFGIANNLPQTLFSVGPQAVGLHSPFEVDQIGDMVRIKKVPYLWPTAHGTGGGPYVLTDTLGNGTLQWLPGGGGFVMGSCTSPAGGTYLAQWVGSPSTTIGCSFLFQQNTTNFIGIGTTTPSKELDVNGEINAQKWYDIGLPETPVLSIGLGPTGSFGDGNLFVGAQAGNNNPIPFGQDTFVGYQAGFNTDPTAAVLNTFVGYAAGYGNTPSTQNTGSLNTYIGWQAGIANTTGGVNVFTGAFAGSSNTTGGGNTYTGYAAGVTDQTGQNNTFTGWFSGVNHTSGFSNSFYGSQSGRFSKCDVSGNCASYNSFFGESSGINNTIGSSNIYIGHPGPAGGLENNTVRIGTNGVGALQQNQVFIEPIISNITGAGDNVTINPTTGQLGMTGSSRRFKERILDMGDSTSRLFQLHPVIFFYKPQYGGASQGLQFGLIAEEVAKVFPEMVSYDKEGQPYTVHYSMLAPMLLNELQKEHTVVLAQQDELQTQLHQISVQRQEIDTLKLQLQQQNASLQERLTKLESYVATQMKTASDNPPRTTPGANGGSQ